MLSQAVKEELAAELEHLRVQRQRVLDQIDAKIRALEAILSDAPPEQSSLPLGEPKAENYSATDLAGKGFRDFLLSVLTSYPTGLRPADVAAKMQQLGFKPGGSSPLKTRVYGELYRLRKRGTLVRRGKKYSVAPEKGDKGL